MTQYLTLMYTMQSLARMGAHVTGIDVAAASVAIAERHAQEDPWIASRVTYREASAEQLVDEGANQGLRILGFSQGLCCLAPCPAACATGLSCMGPRYVAVVYVMKGPDTASLVHQQKKHLPAHR